VVLVVDTPQMVLMETCHGLRLLGHMLVAVEAAVMQGRRNPLLILALLAVAVAEQALLLFLLLALELRVKVSRVVLTILADGTRVVVAGVLVVLVTMRHLPLLLALGA
jgi:hypothetical protein